MGYGRAQGVGTWACGIRPSAGSLLGLCAPPLAPAAARKAMQIASDACIYTNDNYTALHIDGEGKIAEIDIKAAASSSDGGKE